MAFDNSVRTLEHSEPLAQGESFIAERFYSQNQDSYSALKRQSQRLERLLQVMPAGVIVIDGKGIVRQANRLARELLGEPLEEQVWRHIITRSFKPRADDGHEVSLHDGRRVKLSITPLIDEPGQLIVITDLTETRELQARVSHMQRLSSLGKMVASLAHQIRTPLSAALLYASNLSNKNVDGKTREKFTQRVLNRLHDLESQVNDMLLFAKSGDEQVISPVNIGSWLQSVLQSCEVMLQQANVTLHMELSDEAKDAVIVANESALSGALVNLIHNAVQVSEQGQEVKLSACIRDEKLQVDVSDAGPGIESSLLTKIFEPFYTTKTNGTGLGLAVVRSAVSAHKGRISARNLENAGAQFTIELPILRKTDNTVSNPSPAAVTE